MTPAQWVAKHQQHSERAIYWAMADRKPGGGIRDLELFCVCGDTLKMHNVHLHSPRLITPLEDALGWPAGTVQP
jgi:hypothetical protein